LRNCCASKNTGLQANRKTKEGSSHPDRNAQFEHINAKATEYLKGGQPAISVDTKKKEQVGDYKNGGREWRPKGQPELVQVHDFAKQKDVPYGEFTIWGRMQAGSALAPSTPRLSPSRASVAGGA
jgi:hypothetical protein